MPSATPPNNYTPFPANPLQALSPLSLIAKHNTTIQIHLTQNSPPTYSQIEDTMPPLEKYP